jgi:hypothetical protein
MRQTDKKENKNKKQKGGNENNKDKLFCSPSRFDMGKNDNTCFSADELHDIAKDYNNSIKLQQKTPHERITMHTIKLNQKKDKLLKALQKELENLCGPAQHCWVQQDFVSQKTKSKVLNDALRPLKPKEWYNNPKTWLNTYDILKVMKQYEKKYKDFTFLGVFPIDFKEKDENGNCVSDVMCDFTVKKCLGNDKKSRFAMILNLDKHNEPGSHWVSFYCNLNPDKTNFGAYYYDSVAYPPTKEVLSFMKDLKTQVRELMNKNDADKFALRYNKIQKQFGNTECGVFSQVFLTQMCKDIDFDVVCDKMKTDAEINKIRDVLYTPSVT